MHGPRITYECRRPSGAPRWRCKDCGKDFSITSGTLFASHKLPLRGYLAAIDSALVIEANAANWRNLLVPDKGVLDCWNRV